jgi:hypothetical protein
MSSPAVMSGKSKGLTLKLNLFGQRPPITPMVLIQFHWRTFNEKITSSGLKFLGGSDQSAVEEDIEK